MGSAMTGRGRMRSNDGPQLYCISVESQHISVWEYIELPEAKIKGAKSDHPNARPKNNYQTIA